MTPRDRRALAAAIGLPLATMTAYLLWIWPWPRGNPVLADVLPYVASLLTGFPFVLRLTGPTGRGMRLVVFLLSGFVVLWLYALMVLCGLRGVCL